VLERNEVNVQGEFSKLTLRERLTIVERLTRDLSEHVEQGFLPKIESLRKVTRQKDSVAAEVTDKTVRDAAAIVRKSDKFTAELCAKIQECVDSIVVEVDAMVNGE
jgi:hypothetical protein